MKIEDDFCDECSDHDACDEADDCLIAAEGRKRIEDCTPDELLDVTAPDPNRMAVHYSNDRMDWETPPEVFVEYDREFGFTLDVCATPENAKCARYLTPHEDGLSQDWGSNVCWMNPPYGRVIGQWMRKAYEASRRGATVVCLVPSRTDTRWWHEYAERGERRFIRGRIRFVGAKDNAPFPCAIVVFRPEGSEAAA